MSLIAKFAFDGFALQNDEKVNLLDEELRPKRNGPLSPEEQMEIARAVMRKNRAVLAALAK